MAQKKQPPTPTPPHPVVAAAVSWIFAGVMVASAFDVLFSTH